MKDKVSILLSTYNGSNFLEKQLLSIQNQTYPFELFVRDDGSNDNTLEILKNIFNKYNIKGKIIEGSNIGASSSFFELLNQFKHINPYIAFCDQDDIWIPNKLEKAIIFIQENEREYGKNYPLLYHSDLILINDKDQLLNQTFWEMVGLNPKFNQLNRILCQPTVTGCTMVINQSLLNRIENPTNPNFIHDYWISLYASSFGKILIDSNSYIKYRIHNANVIGASKINLKRILSLVFQPVNFIKKWNYEHNIRIEQGKEFYKLNQNNLTIDQSRMLRSFNLLNNANWFYRLLLKFKYKFYQQGLLRNIISFFLF